MTALLVSQVIRRARNLHPALNERNAPNMLAFSALSEFQRDLIGEVTHRVPAFFSQELSIAMEDITLADGIDLGTQIPGGWLDPLELNIQWSSSTRNKPAIFVPWEQRDIPRGFPAYTLRNNVLFLIGSATSWAQVATVFVGYTPIPADVTALDSEFLLPLDARETLATSLANEWLGRLVGNPEFGVTGATASAFESRANGRRTEFLNRIGRTAQRQHYRVRDVGVGGGL